MKHIILLTGFFFFSSFDGKEYAMLPAVEVKKLDGSSFNTSKISNNEKPIILCIWEISCVPCIQEFDRLSKKYADWQSETGVKIVAVSIDDNRNYSKIGPFIKSKGWKFDFYQDKNQDFKRALGVSLCPQTFVIDGKGRILWRKAGYAPGDEEIIYQKVKEVIKGENFKD